MAQIRIEQRRSGLGWLWLIIALIIIAVIVWFLATGSWRTSTAPASVNQTSPSSLETQPASSPSTLPAAV
jgi:ABC-type polysaccharide/polyol phosphate export permease